MRKIILAVACLCTTYIAGAQQLKKVRLDNGTTIGVQVCDEGIFRVRVSDSNEFPQSLMERYGIVKSDWDPVSVSEKRAGNLWTLSTGKYSLAVNLKTGSVALKDAQGADLVSRIDFLKGEEKLSRKVAQMINEQYKDLHVTANNGIIGDDEGSKSKIGRVEVAEDSPSSMISIRMDRDDRIYGGGSTSRDHIQHRGELLRMWTTYQHTEIPMPFMMSSRGWGIYNNTTRKSFFDVGSNEKDVFNIYNTCEDADFYLFAGEGMPGILNEYTLLTGRTYVLPKWAYGLCFGPNMLENQFDILTDAAMFRQSGVPCDVFWLEPQWMSKRYDFSTAKGWNYEKFSPEPYWVQNNPDKKLHHRLFIGKLRNMGFHLGLWLCEEYDLSITEEDAIAEREGRPVSGQEHWMDHLKVFLDYGVEGFKLDPARTIDNHPDWKYYNGLKDDEMHNINQVLLPKQMSQMSREHTGKRTWHHYCGGWSGIQRWSASTSGDNGGGKTALFDQLNLGMSGYLNTSCDVMSVSHELEMPSLHFGLFLPWVQINSWFSLMQPFYYNQKEQGMYRDYVRLRYNLLPYIYSLALEASTNGMPIVRSMPLEFPEDRNVEDMTYQYMFGPSFCLGIFTNEIYLPEGQWIDAWTGEMIQSKGETVIHDYPENRAGLLFIRQGSIIPTQKDVEFIETKPFEELVVKVYPCGDSKFTQFEDDGDSYGYLDGKMTRTTYECQEKDGKIRFIVNPVEGSFDGVCAERSYSFEFRVENKPSSVTVNGKNTGDWTYSDKTLKLNACTVSCSEMLTVDIQ